MKYASFKYDNTRNLGDQIQTLAAEQHLPQVDSKFNRDGLRHLTIDEKHTIIMNGWFSHSFDDCFPPAENVCPIFFGFHVTNWYGQDYIDKFLNPDNVAYLKAHEPIGCRDQKTCQILEAKGIKAFYSKCLTLSFPTRTETPKKEKVIVVDAAHVPLPKHLRKNAVYITQDTKERDNDDNKTAEARELLKLYREEATLIVTSKIHCAMPCIAMGIPVIFFGDPDDYRLSILKDIGQTIYPYPHKASGLARFKALNNILRDFVPDQRLQEVDWNPQVLNIDTQKSTIIETIGKLVKAKSTKA